MYEHAWHTLYRDVVHAGTHTRVYMHTYIFVPYFLASFPYLLWYSLLFLPPLLAFISFFFSRILFSTFTLKRFFRFAASVEVDVDVAVGIFNLYYAVIPCKLLQQGVLTMLELKEGVEFPTLYKYVDIYSRSTAIAHLIWPYLFVWTLISLFLAKINTPNLVLRILIIICR